MGDGGILPDRFDILTFEQQDAILSELDFSVGRRLSAVINHLGIDESVRIAPRSAKQLKRYIDGDEPPMTVLQNLCRAAGVSLDWLIEAEPRSKIDCRLERHLLVEERKQRNAMLASAQTDIDRIGAEFAIASIEGLIEIADLDAERLPERSFEDAVSPSVRRKIRNFATDEPSGGRKPRSPKLQKSAETRELGKVTSDFITIPFLNVEASAGHGAAVAIYEEVRSVISFERAFLRNLGAVPDYCKIIGARGDSMSPTITDGALIVVDHSQRELVNGWISVVNVGGDLLVKRIRRRLDGTVELVSDNAIYPVETIGPDRTDQLNIVGRVVYFCRAP